MKIAEANAITGGLSNPSKMPGYAFGFSATKCITGSKLRAVAGSVCSDCYACKECYVFTSVKHAHQVRFENLTRAIVDVEYRETWVDAMVRLIARRPWFRWHDSGDLQSVDHLVLIAEVCKRTPDVRHWLPTREYRMVAEYLATFVKPENLVIRVSAHMVGDHRPAAAFAQKHGVVASGVSESEAGKTCPARDQGNECGECRACWDPNVPLVIYPLH